MLQKLIISWEKWQLCPKCQEDTGEDDFLAQKNSMSKDTEMGNTRCFQKMANRWEFSEIKTKGTVCDKAIRQAGARPERALNFRL